MKTASRPKQGGFVLLVVLSAVMALCMLLFSFARTTRMSLAKADSFYRTEQAWNGAWGGLQIALAMIRDANDAGADPQYAKLLTAENTFAVGDANCSVVLGAENGLLNVNHLTTPDGQPDRKRVDQFLRLIDALNHQQQDLPPIEYGIVPAIIDWVDKNDDVTCLAFVQHDNLGAENDYYQMRTPPYPCRNGPVHALEELLWVKGMTPEGFARLRPSLTCLGDGKIDINAAPKPVLQSLSEQMDAALADMIIQQRKRKPFQSLGELRNVPGMTDAVCGDIGSLCTVNPKEHFYRVTSQGRLQDYHGTIEALLRKNAQAGTVDIIQYREL
jgi:general secretion pathway protein K